MTIHHHEHGLVYASKKDGTPDMRYKVSKKALETRNSPVGKEFKKRPTNKKTHSLLGKVWNVFFK